jgi:carbonic anhydrase
MKALLNPADVEEMPAVTNWLSHAEATRRIIKENYAHLDDQSKLKAAIEENILVQLENIRTHPSVAAKLAKKEINLHGWYYKIETGQVFSFDPNLGQFTSLTQSQFKYENESESLRLSMAGD